MSAITFPEMMNDSPFGSTTRTKLFWDSDSNASPAKHLTFTDEDDDFQLKPISPKAYPTCAMESRLNKGHSAKQFVRKTDEGKDLIGDGSRNHTLPLETGKHTDLKCISSKTAAAVLRGDYDTEVDSVTIVDCRYPYEFNGGHIEGAINIYRQKELRDFMKEHRYKKDHTRNIVIFHCEFSSKRGPNLLRYMRNQDREMNKENYPNLFFPEVYLLSGGYKDFFTQHHEFCYPDSYTTMLDEQHRSELSHFRSESKKGKKGSRTQTKLFWDSDSNASPAKHLTFTDEDDDFQLKPISSKAYPTCAMESRLNKGHSAKQFVRKTDEGKDLIGDGSRNHTLPLETGKHTDLKCISSKTAAAVLRGDYDTEVDSVTIVDCRYPYEFNGGHIEGAINIYRQKELRDFMKDHRYKKDHTRNIVIFHCEFSSKRGPNLLRYMRNQDREMNKENYPNLFFPEVYLLSGGYKDFFTQHHEFCYPDSYTTMLDEQHRSELSHFRSESKKGKKGSRTQTKLFWDSDSNASPAKHLTFTDEDDDFQLKPISSKAYPTCAMESRLNKGHSAKQFVRKTDEGKDLIGDGSRNHTLPLETGKHTDLKCISSKTAAAVLRGDYDTEVDSVTIVDCRYPYEFNGGHIEGAINIYRQKELRDFMKDHRYKKDHTRNIVIFHCEFSSKRGPNLLRYMRNQDREMNKENYPNLFFPEVYLLSGGYKDFFTQHHEFCYPDSYTTMLDEQHRSELSHFRSESKKGKKGSRTQTKLFWDSDSNASPAKHLTFTDEDDDFQLKPISSKAYPTCAMESRLNKGHSAKQFVRKTDEGKDLIGDGSRNHTLPLETGKHTDLKCISSKTAAAVLRGDYDTEVDSVTIVDCRYPYEFNGGHIEGAINIYRQKELRDFMKDHRYKKDHTRNIVIFHCEFSSKRGPNLLRYMRNQDREMNKENYPNLFFPEVYLLSGGYKDFFTQHHEFCYPDSYTTMLDEQHRSELSHFRSESKKGQKGSRTQSRLHLRL
ncbi:hypothetical protein ScPMuIL_015020 [Solemya velum]